MEVFPSLCICSMHLVCLYSCFPSGYTEHFEHFKVVTLTNLLHNIQTFYEYPAQILYIPFSLFNLFFWVNCLLGLYISSRKLTAESVYLVSTIMLLICWPYDVIRYWLPLFPLCFIFFIQGFRFMCMVWGKKRENGFSIQL